MGLFTDYTPVEEFFNEKMCKKLPLPVLDDLVQNGPMDEDQFVELYSIRASELVRKFPRIFKDRYDAEFARNLFGRCDYHKQLEQHFFNK